MNEQQGDQNAERIRARRRLDALRVELAQYNRQWPRTMTVVSQDSPLWASLRDTEARKHLTNPPIQAWRSSRFVACLYVEPDKTARRLSICRARLDDTGRYEADITWDDIQQIKSECGFGDLDAVEVYPRDADVVNVANMRHLWLLPEPSALVWR